MSSSIVVVVCVSRLCVCVRVGMMVGMIGTKRRVVAGRLEYRKMTVPLLRPFGIATTRLESIESAAARMRLRVVEEEEEEEDEGRVEKETSSSMMDCYGYGEVPILHPVTAETQAVALESLGKVSAALEGVRVLAEDKERELEAGPSPRDAACAILDGFARSEYYKSLRSSFPDHDFASVRSGVECAIVDALARTYGMSLYMLFRWYRGGASKGHTTLTDITIPICDEDEARVLAEEYKRRGFVTIKAKVGLDFDADMRRLAAIRAGFPTCALVIDANEGFDAEQALALLEAMRDAGIGGDVVLEQPVVRDDFAGLARVSAAAREYGIKVAADESCRSADDARKLTGLEAGPAATTAERCCDIVNIKLAKVGVVEALEIVDVCTRAGVELMIGGMVETRLGMGFSASMVRQLSLSLYLRVFLFVCAHTGRGGTRMRIFERKESKREKERERESTRPCESMRLCMYCAVATAESPCPEASRPLHTLSRTLSPLLHLQSVCPFALWATTISTGDWSGMFPVHRSRHATVTRRR